MDTVQSTSDELTREQVVKSLHAFLLEELLDDGTISIVDPDENLLLSGLVDSTGAVRLAMHVEESFDIEVPATEFTLDNFATLNLLSAYVLRKRAT